LGISTLILLIIADIELLHCEAVLRGAATLRGVAVLRGEATCAAQPLGSLRGVAAWLFA